MIRTTRIAAVALLSTIFGCTVQTENAETAQEALVGPGGSRVATFSAGQWRIDMNGSGTFDGGDVTASWGTAGDIPLSFPLGTWTCPVGVQTVLAVYRPSERKFFVDTNPDRVWGAGDTTLGPFLSTVPGTVDVPFVWVKQLTGGAFPQCRAVVGIFRHATAAGSPATWFVDWNENGVWNGSSTDRQWPWGMTGDKPVPVKHFSSGTQLSVFRAGAWLIDKNGNKAWDGCGIDSCTSFGASTDIPFADPAVVHIGTSRGSEKFLDANGDKSWGVGDLSQFFGPSSWLPVLGNY